MAHDPIVRSLARPGFIPVAAPRGIVTSSGYHDINRDIKYGGHIVSLVT